MGVETKLRASRLAATFAMTDDNQLSFNLPSVSRKKVTAAFDGGRLSSDSGVMLLALADRLSTGRGISSLWGVQFSPLGGLAISRFLDQRLRFSAVDHDA